MPGITISMIFVVVTAPALGVIADKMPIKKKLLKCRPWWGYYLLHSWELRHILPQGHIILALCIQLK